MASAVDALRTGIKVADEIISLARAFDLAVTVERQEEAAQTRFTVRFGMRVPVAYAGTELGRAIEDDTLTVVWAKSHWKGARGRMLEATAWSGGSSQKVRTLALVEEGVRRLGHDAARYAREAAPLPEDVVPAPHALYIDGKLRYKGIPAATVRRIVNNRRARGWLVHQDDERAVCVDNRRYVPVTGGREGAAGVAPVPGRTYRVVIAEQQSGYTMAGQEVTAQYVAEMIKTLGRTGVTPFPVGAEGIIGLGSMLYVPAGLFGSGRNAAPVLKAQALAQQ
ncbi:hypothetical protein [Streptomyces glaucus]|uniref:Uncharacterized protein n=1 Tax=Streptomyces glaucus TaxID=284029 RepID=A0ABP5WXK6_9ACTN